MGSTIGQMALHAQISPFLLAWFVAGLIRIATGSATGAGFWLVKQCFTLPVVEPFKTWPAMAAIIPVVAICFIMAFAAHV